jgi:hypothetical protein
MCKTCIFQTNGHQVELSPERYNEILTYLATGQSSHICHTTQKTCYGALQYQATIFKRLGWIKEETVECLQTTVKNVLDL